MYKNKGLKRSYVFAYIMVLFGLLVPVLLSVKVGVGLAIFMLLLVLATLAGLIVSHVFYGKDDKLYFIIGGSSICAYNVLTLIGFIFEIVYTAQGHLAQYAWFMLVITLFACGFLDLFFALDYFNKKKENKESNK